MSDTQLYIFDLEVFPNFFYALFVDYDSQTHHSFTVNELSELKKFVQQGCILVGYNSRNYDDIILRQILNSKVKTCNEIYQLSQKIISQQSRNDPELKKLHYDTHPWGDIDLMQIKPPTLTGKVTDWSLKKHQIRLRWKDVRDLPYRYDKELDEEEITNVIEYCANDVLSTLEVFDDFVGHGVIEVAQTIEGLYPELQKKPFYTSQASLGNEIVSTKYRNSVGLSRWSKIDKPAAVIFDPKTYLLRNIAFTDPRNQEAFEHIKSIPPENVVNIEEKNNRKANKGCTDWEKRHLKDVRFWAGDIPIRVGVGGIHTDFNQEKIEGTILDFDVTSYYPSMIEVCGRSPVGLSDEWLKQYVKTFNQRVQYKKDGNTAASNVLKIIINSVYGQLNYPKSDFFDPAMQIMVTLNGQLFLIMLAEMFATAGFRIVSANTDGVMIKVESEEEKSQSIAIGDAWMKATAFNLEMEEYKLYVAQSINHYFAVKPNGKTKKKGIFNNTSGFLPSVIADGVVDYYVNGTMPDDSVRNKDNIFDFIRAGQAIKGSAVTWEGQPLQRNNRWYFSTDGAPIFHQREGGNRNRLSGSDSCVPVNKIENTQLPPDLNYQHYVDEINKIIAGIDNQLPAIKKDPLELIYQARQLEKQGLCVQPKGKEDNPKANLPGNVPTEKTDIPLDEYAWYQYNGVGILTGKNFGVLAIDVDNLPLARKSGIYKHTQKSKSHLATWHGSNKRKDVVAGESNGTILYLYDQDDFQTTGKAFADQFGFEILYGKKVVQAMGVHNNGEPYQFGGVIKPLPDRLRSFLQTCLESAGTENEYENQDKVFVDVDESHAELERFRKVADSHKEYRGLGSLYLTERNGRVRLEGPCPYGHADSSGHEFAIDFDGEQYIPSCQHQKCRKDIKVWTSSIVETLAKRVEDVEKLVEIEFPSEQAKDIADVFQRDDRFILTLAPTGSGKSFNVTRYVAHRLVEDSGLKKNERSKFFVLCSSKDEMKQCAEQLCIHLDTKDLTQFGIDIVESQGSMQIHDTKSTPEYRDSALVVITHFTYASRKGKSTDHYSMLKFVDERTEVIIDEVDKFIESQTITVPFGWRGRLTSTGGEVKYQHFSDCLVSAGAGNCTQCKMRKYDGYEYRRDNAYGILDLKPRSAIYEQDKYEANPNVNLLPHIAETMSISPTVELTVLNQSPETRDIQYEDVGNKTGKNFENFVNDLILTSWKPSIWRHKISYADETEISTDFVRDNFIQDGKIDRKAIEENQVQFPRKVCNVLSLIAVDRLPIQLFSKCKRTIGLTATISEFKQQFLVDHLDGMVKVEVEPRDDQKMEKILLIGTTRKLPKEFLASFNAKRVLRFLPKKGKAWEEFKYLSKSKRKVLFGVDSSTFRSSEGYINKRTSLYDILVTYSFGNLGRGVNLGDYPVSIIDSSVYKPISAYNTSSKEEVLRLVEDDRRHTIVQNVGRNWRASDKEGDNKVRVNILEKLNGESELDGIADLAKLMGREVQTIWIPPFVPDRLVEALIEEIVQNENLLENPPTTFSYYTDYFYNQGLSGASLVKTRESVQWKYRMSRFFSDREKEDLKKHYQKGVADRKSVNKADEKRTKQQEKWANRIAVLSKQGWGYGKIKGRMNYGKFKDIDKQWFDTIGSSIFEESQD